MIRLIFTYLIAITTFTPLCASQQGLPSPPVSTGKPSANILDYIDVDKSNEASYRTQDPDAQCRMALGMSPQTGAKELVFPNARIHVVRGNNSSSSDSDSAGAINCALRLVLNVAYKENSSIPVIPMVIAPGSPNNIVYKGWRFGVERVTVGGYLKLDGSDESLVVDSRVEARMPFRPLIEWGPYPGGVNIGKADNPFSKYASIAGGYDGFFNLPLEMTREPVTSNGQTLTELGVSPCSSGSHMLYGVMVIDLELWISLSLEQTGPQDSVAHVVGHVGGDGPGQQVRVGFPAGGTKWTECW